MRPARIIAIAVAVAASGSYVVSCVAANSLTYRVERTSSGWKVAGVAARGPVS